MKTLKISDLSVGDWVAIEAADLKIEHGNIATAFVEEVRKPICVQSIIGESKLVLAEAYLLDSYGTLYAKEEHLRPIPITPEILEANGFVKNGEYNEWNIGTWQTPSLLGVSLERPAITIKWNGSSIFIDRAKYVHQLQHALRLAGVDKEIVMPKK